jgi:capsular polysaccharide transport system permease protein
MTRRLPGLQRPTARALTARAGLPRLFAPAHGGRVARTFLDRFRGAVRFVSNWAPRSAGEALSCSFIAAVLLPTLFFWIYAAFWQSPRFVSETRIVVREAQRQKKEQNAAIDLASALARGHAAPARDAQNAYIALNYFKSRAIVVDLGGRGYFERKFARREVDHFSRLSRGAALEDLWKYWLGHVSANVDALSGVLNLRVDAFGAQDALDLATDVVRLAEELVNRITLRNRADALARAEAEVDLARRKLAEAREKLLSFRNRNALVDPGARAASLGELIGKLTLERIDVVNALSAFDSTLSNDSPSARLHATRLASIDRQLAELRKKLTDSEGSEAVSAQIAGYERLKLEEQFAESMYAVAQTAYHAARQDLERQQLYLVAIVRPTRPESASFPRVGPNTLLVFTALLILWSIVALVVASVRDQIE